MASGKETPRQRMIGMMYLVLTALLALNVSKDLLNAFVVINDGLVSTNNTLENKSESVMAQFKAQLAVDEQKTRPFYDRALIVKSEASEFNAYVEALKNHLIDGTEGYDETMPDSMYLLRNVSQKDNYDVPTQMLIGSEAASPIKGAFTATELREKIESFRASVVDQFDPNKDGDFISKVETDLALKEVPNGEGKLEPWEIGNFYHLPLAACITNLTKIQADIRATETDALKSLYDNISVDAFKFDTIAAKVIPRSNYVLLGENYEADVFLAAFSSTEQPEMLLGNTDPTSGDFQRADSLVVEQGLGKMVSTTTSEGFKTYEGVIKMKRNDGTTKDYPFKSEYLVAKPSLTVAPTKMNVLYKGIKNPIKVSAPGVPNENLRVSITGGSSLRPTGDGAFEVNVSKNSPTTAEVVVVADLGDGRTREMGREKFRVKRLPKPYAKIGSITTTGRMSGPEIIARQGIRALYADDFEFQFICRVMSFEMSAIYQGNIVDPVSKSNAFTQEMKVVLRALPSGSKVTFSKIKAEGDDGVQHELSPIVITII